MDNNNNNEVNLNSYYTGRNISPKKKKHKGFKVWWSKRALWQKVTLISLSSLLSLVLIIGGTGAIWFFSTLNKIERDKDFSSLTNEEKGFTDVIDQNVYNIALFGVDARTVGSFSGNSDSIMIISINKKDNTIRLASIMRDSLVPYTKDGVTRYTKITEVHGYGGPALAVKTLNTVYGLDISEYASVNFYGMKDIIDAVGGIDVEITSDEIRSTNQYNINAMIAEQCEYLKLSPSKYYVNKTGKMHLNGLQAVAYARIRHGVNVWGSNDDFGRTERQRYVMQQLFEKALEMNVTEYPALVNKLTPFLKTSLSNKKIIDLAGILAKKPEMINTRVPANEYIINADYRGTGASTVYYNYKYAGKVLRAFFYDGIDPEEFMKTNTPDLTGWHVSTYVPDVDNEPDSPDDSSSVDMSGSDGNVSEPDFSDSSDDSSDNSSSDTSQGDTSDSSEIIPPSTEDSPSPPSTDE